MLKRQFTDRLQMALRDLPKSINNPKLQRLAAEWGGLFQPLWVASRVRIIKLNAAQLEAKISVNPLTQAIGRPQELEESFLMLAANQGLKFFLKQMSDQIEYQGLKEFKLEVLIAPIQGPVRFKLQMTEIEREALRERLNQAVRHELDLELVGHYFSNDDKMVATSQWTARVKLVKQIQRA